MWVRGAAIRPVPRYAVVERETLERIEQRLADDSSRGREELDAAFARFESTQPHVADAISQALSRPLDETALALGYFLSIAIWLAFEETFGEERLREVSPDALQATASAIALEEELRASRGDEPFDLDDVVSIEQPNVLAFVHEHVDAALDPLRRASERSGTGSGAVTTSITVSGAGAPLSNENETDTDTADVDDVHTVYRATILLTMCLSHAVVPVDGAARGRDELIA
jgi:hypothetical protein